MLFQQPRMIRFHHGEGVLFYDDALIWSYLRPKGSTQYKQGKILSA